MIPILLCALAGYLFGSISTSVLITKGMYKVDVRTKGSGNAGATNVARVFGMSAGLLTFLCDGLKTIASAVVGHLLAGQEGVAVAAAACVIGHCWPVFFGFRGGKGVSVGAIIALIVDWKVLLLLAIVFFSVFALTHIVSICSISVAILLPVGAFLLGQPLPDCLLALFTGLLVVFQHRSNIGRLIRGEESKFKPKSKE